MDRNREYHELMSGLCCAPDTVEHALRHAERRLRRRALIIRPIACVICVLVCFTALVNLSSPAAQAFSHIPVLRELAAAVSFSRSLSDAVENEYVQPLHLADARGGITANVEYLIVDRRQVTVFFRLGGEGHEMLTADIEFMRENGGSIGSCIWGLNDFQVPAGQLQSATLDIVEGELPGRLRLLLSVYDPSSAYPAEVPPDNADPMFADYAEEEHSYLAEFDFLLEFDPEFTEAGTILELDRSVQLDGQTIIIESAEIYPSHMRLNVHGAGSNTAWLKSLGFYVETDSGERFDTVKNGVSATGSTGTPEMVSFRADSTYFHTAKHLTLYITGAEWLDKDMEKIHVDLSACTADAMPEGAELVGAERKSGGYLITVKARQRAENSLHQIFLGIYYDPLGEEHCVNSSGSAISFGELYPEQDGFFYETFALLDYPYDEVWLVPAYSRTYTAAEPFGIQLK